MLKINLRPSEWLKIGVLILVFVIGSISAYKILQPKRKLPIYNPSDLNPSLVDDDLERVGRGHRVGNFDLIDQWGNSVDSSLLLNKIYIADFFFTTCPAICIDMGQNFQLIQEVYKEEEKITRAKIRKSEKSANSQG